MMLYVRILGGILLILSAAICSRAYSRYAEGQLAQLEGFSLMLSHIRSRIAIYLAPESELLRDFECEAMESCGFLTAYCNGCSLKESYAESRLSVPEDARRVLGTYFNGFGGGYKGDELARLDCAISELSQVLSRERADVPKDVRLTRILLAAAALGILILLI